LAEKIPLFVSVAEFASDPNGIKHLQGAFLVCKGPEQAI
jgi:hypothetical protein